jgi:hypothetical protein
MLFVDKSCWSGPAIKIGWAEGKVLSAASGLAGWLWSKTCRFDGLAHPPTTRLADRNKAKSALLDIFLMDMERCFYS